ncbi:dTDP-4-dehydrorhamnose 3,5-epimerase [Saonia flava]|uniref:dTDP-4-dehydrorhamnose 3,5-epimerase n=1 Tax=Saonia flava TaxID=523696 RepID=A0A846QWD5_9FLAO|nr:dTDP-4-dehydrorhamnose 3,5-epimerase [Saonia flava]NJB72651.1 dTDP-4-dehydrorhamnose 3,5-epimerase [Saonia flava]
MNFKKLNIPEVILCEPKVIGDERGYFFETFREDKFTAFLGKKINFCQDNESKSSYGVLRGLHYQSPPFAQAKLVRVIEGSVLDVVVDLRMGSPTFGQHVAVELNSELKNQLFIPKGFAHGFVVLSKEAIFAYKADNYYNYKSEKGILFNDPELAIDWKLNGNNLKLSEKDAQLPLFRNAEYFETKNQ